MGEQYGLGVVRASLEHGMAAGALVEQPVGPLAHVMIGALDEAALYVARAEDGRAAREEMAMKLGVFTVLFQGLPFEQALENMVRRVKSDDLELMATAISIQHTVGGNLAEILDSIAYTIRERLRIRREIQTLTAQERMSSYVVGALPIVAFVFLTFVNPSYLDLLFATDMGRMLLGGAIVLELIGFFIIQRIIDIKI
jgi:Flp pilus assembly protein TadB